MLKTLTIPLLATLLAHLLLVAAFLVDWSGERVVIKRQTPKYIEAKLVTLEKPKVKPVKKKPAPKAPVKKPIAPIIPEQPKVVAKAQPLIPKIDPLAAAQQQQKTAEQQALQQQKQQLLDNVFDDLNRHIEKEAQAQQAMTDAELANSHIALITQAIERNWSRPASARNGMEAELILDLVPTGEVVNVRVVKSSGSDAFDRSAVAAVKRARQFIELQQLPNHVFEKFFRRLRMKFKPEDLRR